MTDTTLVSVIDTSALINIKHTIPAAEQWALLRKLESMVEDGLLFFPIQVANELGVARFIDTPEAWALGVGPRVTRCYDPDPNAVRHVMSVAGNVVEFDSERERADPYVLAQALELMNLGLSVQIVTDDDVDRLPLKIALTTAAAQLGIRTCSLEDFLGSI